LHTAWGKDLTGPGSRQMKTNLPVAQEKRKNLLGVLYVSSEAGGEDNINEVVL